jgi:CRP-like cAMP-binding protein
MADSAVKVFQGAEDDLRRGKYPEALAGYLRVVRAAPDFYRARFRIADTLLNLKARPQALEIYKAIAWQAIKAGQPLAALVAIKMATLLDPKQIEAIEIMAELYSKSSDRVGPAEEGPQHRGLTDKDSAGDLGGLSGQALIDAAASEAADTSAIANYPGKLPAVPLFSFLDHDAFLAVLASLQLRRYVKGQAIITEGQAGDSFFILAEGNVEVTRTMGDRTVSLARLHPGAVFGEMALISKAPRTATVAALEDCDLLELKRASLEAESHRLASVTQALKEFTHDRFLQNLTGTSAIFRPFPKSIRTEIVRKFKDFPVDPGDELIAEGEQGQGLFLILKGSIEVSKKDGDGAKIVLATLKEGDVFGEISLIQETPTTATCSAVTRGDLLFLPKKDFVSTMARHPEMKSELAKITAERVEKTKRMLDPSEYVLIEDDDLIML